MGGWAFAISYSRSLRCRITLFANWQRDGCSRMGGAEHLHLYVYGSDYTIITDHKPLLGIVNSTKPASARIEIWRLRLTPYNFNLIYKPVRDETNQADFLSCHPAKQPAEAESIAENYVQLCLSERCANCEVRWSNSRSISC
jgi:hypothetical protein